MRSEVVKRLIAYLANQVQSCHPVTYFHDTVNDQSVAIRHGMITLDLICRLFVLQTKLETTTIRRHLTRKAHNEIIVLSDYGTLPSVTH